MAVLTHPFGPPMEATLSRDGGELLLTWTAAEDDWMVVGDLSGAFAERAAGETGQEVLSESPKVHAFLAEHLTISQGGAECSREWLPTRDLLGEGVRASFACPDPHAPVSIQVDVLTDVNAAYRTVLRADSVGDVLFTSTEPEQEIVTAGLGAGGAAGNQLILLAVLLAVAVLAAVALGVLLARGSSRRAADTPGKGVPV